MLNLRKAVTAALRPQPSLASESANCRIKLDTFGPIRHVRTNLLMLVGAIQSSILPCSAFSIKQVLRKDIAGDANHQILLECEFGGAVLFPNALTFRSP